MKGGSRQTSVLNGLARSRGTDRNQRGLACLRPNSAAASSRDGHCANGVCVCVCVCVLLVFLGDSRARLVLHFVAFFFCPSKPTGVRRTPGLFLSLLCVLSHAPPPSSAVFASIFVLSREGFSRPFPRRQWSRFFFEKFFLIRCN